MIINGTVTFNYQDVHGGVSAVEIPEDIFRVFVAQARTLEELRCLVFGWPTRNTAQARNDKRYKAKGATA